MKLILYICKMKKKQCPQCGVEVRGRSDKLYCSLACKNAYSLATRRATRDAVAEIDGYLHRNREILAMLMGEVENLEIDRMALTRTGFRYEFHTSIYYDKEGKLCHTVYDYAWVDCSVERIQLVRKKDTDV